VLLYFYHLYDGVEKKYLIFVNAMVINDLARGRFDLAGANFGFCGVIVQLVSCGSSVLLVNVIYPF
jgi:hypothetical protein